MSRKRTAVTLFDRVQFKVGRGTFIGWTDDQRDDGTFLVTRDGDGRIFPRQAAKLTRAK